MSMPQTLEAGRRQEWKCSFRADFERISEDLHSFGVLEPVAQLPEHRLIETDLGWIRDESMNKRGSTLRDVPTMTGTKLIRRYRSIPLSNRPGAMSLVGLGNHGCACPQSRPKRQSRRAGEPRRRPFVGSSSLPFPGDRLEHPPAREYR